MSNAANQVTQERDSFITINPPYNGADDVFYQIFNVFPTAQVPKAPEELLEFKSKLEEFLSFAEMQEVDVFVHDRNQYISQIIRSVFDFENSCEYINAIKDPVTPDLPDSGNFWAISSEPFEPHFNSIYDNVMDIIDPRFTALGNLEPTGNLDLPNSSFDTAHRLGSTNQSELRIVDRLSKYGESFPFLNEDGKLSDTAKADFEELLLSEATDDQLIAFLKDGIDAVKSVGSAAKDGVKAVGDALGLTNDGKRRKLEKEELKRDLEDKKEEKLKKQEDKVTEKERAEIAKARAEESLRDAKDELKDVEVKKAAKAAVEGNAKDPALVDKNDAFKQADKAVDQAIDAKVSPNSVTNTKGKVKAQFDDEKRKLKEKEHEQDK